MPMQVIMLWNRVAMVMLCDMALQWITVLAIEHLPKPVQVRFCISAYTYIKCFELHVAGGHGSEVEYSTGNVRYASFSPFPSSTTCINL